jgi:hypothetical protein
MELTGSALAREVVITAADILTRRYDPEASSLNMDHRGAHGRLAVLGAGTRCAELASRTSGEKTT